MKSHGRHYCQGIVCRFEKKVSLKSFPQIHSYVTQLPVFFLIKQIYNCGVCVGGAVSGTAWLGVRGLFYEIGSLLPLSGLVLNSGYQTFEVSTFTC